MTKYHVNANGDAKPCTSTQGRCPFGDAEAHHETADAARSAYEASMGNSFNDDQLEQAREAEMALHVFDYEDLSPEGQRAADHYVRSCRVTGIADEKSDNELVRQYGVTFDHLNDGWQNYIDEGIGAKWIQGSKPDGLDEVIESAKFTTDSLIDANGERGNYHSLGANDKEVFRRALDLVDVDELGQHTTTWVNGEPIDDQGYHQYFFCVSRGLEVLEEIHREQDTFEDYRREHGESIAAFYRLEKKHSS